MLVKDKISMLRKQKGMTTAQLAEAAGVNKGSINRYENGSIKVISGDVLRRIAKVLDVTLNELVAGDPKYHYLSSNPIKEDTADLTIDELELLEWYRGLSDEGKKVVSKLWKNS